MSRLTNMIRKQIRSDHQYRIKVRESNVAKFIQSLLPNSSDLRLDIKIYWSIDESFLVIAESDYEWHPMFTKVFRLAIERESIEWKIEDSFAKHVNHNIGEAKEILDYMGDCIDGLKGSLDTIWEKYDEFENQSIELEMLKLGSGDKPPI